VLFVDPLSLRDSEPMLRLARAHRIPIVADIEAEHADTSRPVTPMIDHMVVPLSAARVLSGCETPETAARALAANRRAAVVTLGEQGCWYAAGPKAERVRHLPAFRVEARNTTGCGDVFHGAYALGVARGWPLERCVAFAAAAAAVRAEGSASAGAVTRASRVRELLRNRRTME
jgi:sugar/nucleoside kinase (ribokinase family)